MSKFNLKNYKKLNLDEHTEMRLKEQHSETPDVINEAQLEKGRVPEKDVTIEALLEKNRTGSATEVTEKRLDTADAKFDNKYRNAETANGNINKLEEQRLKNDPVENEKYEPASETGKQLRWWETSKSPDGLKVASESPKMQKVAINPEDLEEEDGTEDTLRAPEEVEAFDPSIVDPEEFDIVDKGRSGTKSMVITKFKALSGKIPGVWIVLQYDAVDFGGDEAAIATAAMDKIIMEHPEMAGLVDINDLSIQENQGDVGEVIFRGIGDEFANLNSGSNITELAEISFDETAYSEKMVMGTPMAVGTIRVNVKVDQGNQPRVVQEAIEYLKNLHPNLNINPRALDLSNASAGLIGYTAPVEKLDVATDDEFPVEEVARPKKRGRAPVAESSVSQVKEAATKKN